LFYFEELKKKTNSNIAGRTVSALLTEELLEKLMLAKTKPRRIQKGKSTKTDKTDKKLMGIKRDKSGKSSSQIVPRI
jgi:hypothetical protein